jgi:hypothetical protein
MGSLRARNGKPSFERVEIAMAILASVVTAPPVLWPGDIKKASGLV